MTKILEATNCNRTILSAAQPLSAAFNSAIADFKDMPLGAVQVLWTGAAGGPGQFRLYASLVPIESAFDDNEIPLSALEIDQATGTHLWTYERLAFRYLQVRWLPEGTTGGVVDIIAMGKKS